MKTSKIVILTTILFLVISLSTPTGSCTDVSVKAIKARPSENVYSPNTAWELGYKGRGIVIAFIDSGIDNEHETLEGKFVAGVDFTRPDTPLTPRDGSYDPEDAYGHGTAVASIAIGSGGETDSDSDGMPDYIGVAPEAKLVDVKVETVFIPGAAVETKSFTNAIDWCIQHKDTQWKNQPAAYWGIDIISISLGYSDYINSDGSDPVSQAVNKAVNAGLTVIVAAGNFGQYETGFRAPASADDAIVVGGIDDMNTVIRDDDIIWNSSSIGPRADDDDEDHYDELKPDVVAPCCSIMAAKYDTENEYDDEYLGDGTSWVAPHVAGVVALMLEANPDLTLGVVKQILHETAEQRGTPDYPDLSDRYNKSYGWGIVDAYGSVNAALAWRQPNNPPTVSITSPKNNAEVSGTIMISGSASDSDGSVTSVELRFDNNDWFNVSIVSASSFEWNYTWDTKNVENGEHTIYARCYDGMNYSSITYVEVDVYNEVSADGVGEKTKINPIYLISVAGTIGLVIIIVVGVLFFGRKKTSMEPVFPVGTGPPPVTGVPSVTAQCPNCRNIIKITSMERPSKVRCPKCGARSILR